MNKVQRRKSSAAVLSVIANIALIVLKIAVGLAIFSVSVISEAIHSGVDLLAALIALFAVRTSGKPADEEHPFGHGKIENISGTVEALLIFGAAAWIVYDAVEKLRHPSPMGQLGWGVGVMLISAIVNVFLTRVLFRVGKETDSIALQADGWHHLTDVYTSIGVMAGLGAIWLAERLLPGMHLGWLDPVAAIGVALLILRAAYKLTVESGRDLLDVSLPEDEAHWIRDYVASLNGTVQGFHHLRTRKAGSQRFVQFHLLVSPQMSVDESHRLNDGIVGAIKDRFPDCTVTIHIEPCDATCKPECIEGCLLSEEERQEMRRQA